MKRVILIYVITISVLLSCTSNNTDDKNENKKSSPAVSENVMPKLKSGTFELVESDFGEIIELTGKEQKLNAIVKQNEVEMIVKDDYFIVTSPQSSKIFKVFLLPEFKLIHSFGVTGSGPGEFSYPNLVPTEEKDKICYIYEYSNQKLYYLDKDLNLKTSDFNFPKKEGYASALRQINVGEKKKLFYAGNTDTGKKIFKFQPVSENSEFEIMDLSINDKYKSWAAYEGCFGANIEKDRMVYAYKYFKELKFLNLDGTIEKKIVFDYKKPKSGEAQAMLAPTNTTHYWKISPTKESVYLSYSGRTPIEVNNDFKKGKDYIHIEEFAWNGNPKRKFKLDKWGYFCVDGKRNKLYLLATNAENPFYVYDLN